MAKMTMEELIRSIPAELYAACIAKDRALTEAAAKGCVNLANSTGWLAIPREEAISTFFKACTEFCSRKD